MAGDQQAALFGQACFAPGEGKLTYGTGAFLLVNTGTEIVRSTSNMLTTVAWQIGGETHYALEGSAFVAGAAVQWLRDGLGIIETASEIEGLAAEVEDSGGVVFVPAFTGLGAPHWRQDARASIMNMTRGTSRAHIARACLEGIVFQNEDILEAMASDRGAPVSTLKVDGGACRNNLLMQMQSDISRVEVVRPRHVETTVLGAVFLAGLGAGIWQDTDAIREVWAEDRRFTPSMDETKRVEEKARWKNALERV
jgi:glycerol kinase